MPTAAWVIYLPNMQGYLVAINEPTAEGLVSFVGGAQTKIGKILPIPTMAMQRVLELVVLLLARRHLARHVWLQLDARCRKADNRLQLHRKILTS